MSEGIGERTEIGGASPQESTQYKPGEPFSRPTIEGTPQIPAWEVGFKKGQRPGKDPERDRRGRPATKKSIRRERIRDRRTIPVTDKK